MARRRMKITEPLPRPRSKKEFAAMLYNMFGFLPPAVAVCKGHAAPLDVFWKIYNQEYSNYVVVAARKSGKTMGIAALQVLFALTFEQLDSCNVAATLQQAQICYEHSRNFLFRPKGELGKQLIPKYITDEGTKKEIRLATGSRIFITTGNIRGVNAVHPHKLFMDEVELVEGWHVIQEALLAPRTEGDKMRQVIFISSWKYRGGLLDRIMQTYKDDPSSYIAFWCGFEAMQPIHDCSFCQSLKRKLSDGTVVSFADFCKDVDGTCKGKRARGFISLVDVRNDFIGLEEPLFRAQWLSERPQESGLKVFYISPQSQLARFALIPGYPIFAGVDYGKVSAIVLAQILPTGHIVIYEEYVRYNLSPKEVARLCLEIDLNLRKQYGLKVDAFIIDPRHFYIFQREFSELGLPVVAPWNPSLSYGNEKKSRVAVVNNFLVPDFDSGIPRLLFVAPRTPVLLKQMEEMYYRTDANGLPTDNLPDGNDHCVDAMLYLVSYIYGVGIHKEVEAMSVDKPETPAVMMQLKNSVSVHAPAASDVNDEFRVLKAEREILNDEARKEVLAAIRDYISQTVRAVSQQLNIPARGTDIENIADAVYNSMETYIQDNITRTTDVAELVYNIPKEIEQKLLEITVRELDNLQMRSGAPRWDSLLPYEFLYDVLVKDIFNPSGGGGFNPFNPFPPPF